MFKKINKKGFTLAELLIVVAIIGVLVAISIPIFTAQLRKARLATNQANARAAYAAVTAGILQEGYTGGTAKYVVSTGAISASKVTKFSGTTTATTPVGDWTVSTNSIVSGGKLGDVQAKSWTVTIDKDGKVKFEGKQS